ncbi:MAG: molybdopterin-dependent oxidoreductase [Bryobacteraceae bacterium]
MPGSRSRLGISRRALLAGSAAGAWLRAQETEAIAFDLSLLDDPAVHNELFFVRQHFPQPSGLSAAVWKIEVAGAVKTPSSVPLEALSRLPERRLPATVECAENPVGGGLVSHAEWTGHPLASVLEAARVSDRATHVVLHGADGFAHPIPLSKATHSDTLLVTGMNGEKLPPGHGFPIRAIIPGWYGMQSIKWLNKIEVLEGEPPARAYRRRTQSLLAGTRDDGAVGAGLVKAVFTRPLDGAILTQRGRFHVRGVAWAGEHSIARVELTADGATWHTAQLDDKPQPYVWVRWSWMWTPAAPGIVELAVRATDDAGNQQPRQRTRTRMDPYESNAWQSIRITVS